MPLLGAGHCVCCCYVLVGAGKCHWLVLEGAAHHVMLVVFGWPYKLPLLVLLYCLVLEHAIGTSVNYSRSVGINWLNLGWCWSMP